VTSVNNLGADRYSKIKGSNSGGRLTRRQAKDHMKYSSIKVAGGESLKQQKTSVYPQKEDGLSNKHTDNYTNMKVHNALILAISILLYMYYCFFAFKSCLKIIGLRLSILWCLFSISHLHARSATRLLVGINLICFLYCNLFLLV
jgi:hypothetical protein